jgi:hypothetical protein
VRLLDVPHETVNGHDWRGYRVGQVYDLPTEVADYLVVGGFALVEMRDAERSQPMERPKTRRTRNS